MSLFKLVMSFIYSSIAGALLGPLLGYVYIYIENNKSPSEIECNLELYEKWRKVSLVSGIAIGGLILGYFITHM